MADFILTRKIPKYNQVSQYPKISIQREVYDELKKVAAESYMTISEVASAAIRHALSELKWVDEE